MGDADSRCGERTGGDGSFGSLDLVVRSMLGLQSGELSRQSGGARLLEELEILQPLRSDAVGGSERAWQLSGHLSGVGGDVRRVLICSHSRVLSVHLFRKLGADVLPRQIDERYVVGIYQFHRTKVDQAVGGEVLGGDIDESPGQSRGEYRESGAFLEAIAGEL